MLLVIADKWVPSRLQGFMLLAFSLLVPSARGGSAASGVANSLFTSLLQTSVCGSWQALGLKYLKACLEPFARLELQEAGGAFGLSSVPGWSAVPSSRNQPPASPEGGSQLEVKLVLLWKHNMRIEYVAVAPWPLEPEGPRGTRVEVTMEGGYDILHDVSCALRQPIRSLYRTHVIRRFWNTLQR